MHGPAGADVCWHVPLSSTHTPGAAGTANLPATRKWEHLAHVSAHRGVSRRTSSNGFRKLPTCLRPAHDNRLPGARRVVNESLLNATLRMYRLYTVN